MSAVYSDIQSLLNDQLNSVANLPAVVWENTLYTPDSDELYLEVFLIPSESQNRTIGINAPTYESGIFQINVVGVRGQGWGQAYYWVDTLVNNFARNTVLTNSSVNINLKITKSYPNPGFWNSEGRYVVPVDVKYFGYNFN